MDNSNAVFNAGSKERHVFTHEIITQIFSSCRRQQDALVLVSHLIEFMEPSFQLDKRNVENLRTTLDPDGTNPLISGEYFLEAMIKWSTDLSQNCDLVTISRRNLDEHNVKEAKLSRKKLMDFFQSFTKNASNKSIKSCNTSCASRPADRTLLQEEVQELQCGNRKLADELLAARQQLMDATEQGYMLRKKKDVASKQLNEKSNVSKRLRRERIAAEEREDALYESNLCIRSLETKISSFKKSNEGIQMQIGKAKKEIQQAESKVFRVSKNNEELQSVISALNTDLQLAEQRWVLIRRWNSDLQQEVTEEKNKARQCAVKVEELDIEIKRLRDQRGKLFLRSNKQIFARSNSFSGYPARPVQGARRLSLAQNLADPDDTIESDGRDASLAVIRESGRNFNSPELLRMLKETISPDIGTPGVYKLEGVCANTPLVPMNESAEVGDTISPPVMYAVDRSL